MYESVWSRGDFLYEEPETLRGRPYFSLLLSAMLVRLFSCGEKVTHFSRVVLVVVEGFMQTPNVSRR